MAEKIYSFTHRISETKLFAALATHSDDVIVNIEYAPERKTSKRQLQNGHDAPLMLEGPKPKPPKEAKQPKEPHQKKRGARFAILQVLSTHSKRVVANAEITAHAKTIGVTPGSISVEMSKLIKNQMVERVANGQYKILKEGIALAKREVGAAEATPAKPPKEKAPPKKRNRGGRDLIWAELIKGEPIAAMALRPMLTKIGLDANSVSSAFNFLKDKGFATAVSPGVIQITEEGKAHHAAKSIEN